MKPQQFFLNFLLKEPPHTHTQTEQSAFLKRLLLMLLPFANGPSITCDYLDVSTLFGFHLL